jgi:sugar phosphate permease
MASHPQPTPILPDMKNRLQDERSQPDGLDQPVAATHVRWVVMSIVMAIMAVTALNRLNLSIAGKYIEEEFSFNTISMGMVFGAFLWGYALFQVPWGYVCDRIGPRRTLTASILCFAV